MAVASHRTRSGNPLLFEELPAAQDEVVAIAGLFQVAFEVDPVLLTREKTTKAALFAAAPGKTPGAPDPLTPRAD